MRIVADCCPVCAPCNLAMNSSTLPRMISLVLALRAGFAIAHTFVSYRSVFAQMQCLPGSQIGKILAPAARPHDFNPLYQCCFAEAEMQGGRVLRKVRALTSVSLQVVSASCRYSNQSANALTVAFGPLEIHLDPIAKLGAVSAH